jgi:hypothetical protein
VESLCLNRSTAKPDLIQLFCEFDVIETVWPTDGNLGLLQLSSSP